MTDLRHPTHVAHEPGDGCYPFAGKRRAQAADTAHSVKPLSKRAADYLKTLKRAAAVPVDEVAAALARTGFPVHPAWLEFHERYAGYVEPLGRETAILGIAHRQSQWIRPGEAEVDTWDDGELVVTCADVHPSFSYILFPDGHFWSTGGYGECETYDTKVEQSAIFVEAIADGRKWARVREHSRATGAGLERLRTAAFAERVDEASDKFHDAWIARDVTWLEGRGEARSLDLWCPESERERICALLRDSGP